MESMKHQINLLCQLQELILTRDEHHHTGDGSHLDSLNDSIDALVDKLEPQPKTFYQRLYKKDHLVMSPMVDGCCGVCGMRLPVSQVQQVRLARTIQMCSSCGRMLYDEEVDAPRVIAEKPMRGEPRKTGISRFSAEELMVCDLKGSTTEAVIRELAEAMAANRFVSNADRRARGGGDGARNHALHGDGRRPRVPARAWRRGRRAYARAGHLEEGLRVRRRGDEGTLRVLQRDSRGGERVLLAAHEQPHRGVLQEGEPRPPADGEDVGRALEGVHEGHALQHPLIRGRDKRGPPGVFDVFLTNP